jgi:hypothetical protein
MRHVKLCPFFDIQCHQFKWPQTPVTSCWVIKVYTKHEGHSPTHQLISTLLTGEATYSTDSSTSSMLTYFLYINQTQLLQKLSHKIYTKILWNASSTHGNNLWIGEKVSSNKFLLYTVRELVEETYVLNKEHLIKSGLGWRYLQENLYQDIYSKQTCLYH